MKRIVPFVLLLAALGGGVWFWKGRSSNGGKGAAAGADAAPAATAAKDDRPAKPAKGDQGGGPPGGARLDVDDDPEGALRLEGQVIDAEDRPVAGAVVALSSNPPREVITEADGAFEFDGLLQRGYAVVARKGDELGGPTTVNVTAKVEPVTLRLKAGSTLEVTVLDAEKKKPIAGAEVEARGLAAQKASTGNDGVARLRGLGGGGVAVAARAPGYGPAHAVYQLPQKPGTVQQTVLLHKGTPVAGRVVDHEGKPVAGARVVARTAATMWSPVDEKKDGVLSDAEGKWKLPAVAPGSWRFTAKDGKHAPGQSEVVALEAGRPPAEVLITMGEGGTLAGEVHDTSGKPVPYATVRVTTRSENTMMDWGGGREAACDADGRFLLEGLRRGELRVLAAHETGTSDVVKVDLAAVARKTDLILVLAQAGAIAGVVVAPDGKPIAEARVFAWPELSEGSDGDDPERWQLLGSVSDVADQAGAFRLTGLPDGKYRLRASRGESDWDDVSAWQRPGTAARTGDEGVKIVLEPDAVVKGKLVYADGSAPELFTVSTALWGNPQPFSSKNGEFRLEGVAPGKRMLTFSGPGFARKTTDEITVKPGAETDVGSITVERGRTVRGQVRRPDGAPAAGALVVAGARFWGDGKSIGDPNLADRMGSKTATADEAGRYEILGVGVKGGVLVADHDSGRSRTLTIPPGTGDLKLDIVVEPPAVLEGLVKNGDTPLAGAIVIVQTAEAWRGQYVVTSGDDGKFRYDKLAPGAYQVSAMRTRGIGGGAMQTTDVVLEAGKTSSIELQLPKTDLSLTVTLKDPAGQPVKTAMLFLASGRLAATTAKGIEDALAARGKGTLEQTLALGGQPYKFENLIAGAYTVCVLAIPGDVNDPGAMEKLQKNADELPVTCQPVTITASPAAQTLSFTVPLPAPTSP